MNQIKFLFLFALIHYHVAAQIDYSSDTAEYTGNSLFQLNSDRFVIPHFSNFIDSNNLYCTFNYAVVKKRSDNFVQAVYYLKGDSTCNHENYSLIEWYQFENDSNIVIYPNPALDKLHISDIKDLPFDLRMYNVTGQLIKNLYQVRSNQEIDISQLINGVYCLSILDKDGNYYSEAFLKE